MNDVYDRAAQDLPNFPRAVIELWFEHTASAGWPPPVDAAGRATGIWGTRVFGNRPLSFWRGVTWSLEHLALSPLMIEPLTGQIVDQLGIAFTHGLPHPPGIPIADASARIGRFVDHLRRAGRLPVPPILLRVGPGTFEVLDGSHRLAALFAAQATGIPVEPRQAVWVATPSAQA